MSATPAAYRNEVERELRERATNPAAAAAGPEIDHTITYERPPVDPSQIGELRAALARDEAELAREVMARDAAAHRQAAPKRDGDDIPAVR
jgi:hypothetical protein